jgi:hypothetical protein
MRARPADRHARNPGGRAAGLARFPSTRDLARDAVLRPAQRSSSRTGPESGTGKGSDSHVSAPRQEQTAVRTVHTWPVERRGEIPGLPERGIPPWNLVPEPASGKLRSRIDVRQWRAESLYSDLLVDTRPASATRVGPCSRPAAVGTWSRSRCRDVIDSNAAGQRCGDPVERHGRSPHEWSACDARPGRSPRPPPRRGPAAGVTERATISVQLRPNQLHLQAAGKDSSRTVLIPEPHASGRLHSGQCRADPRGMGEVCPHPLPRLGDGCRGAENVFGVVPEAARSRSLRRSPPALCSQSASRAAREAIRGAESPRAPSTREERSHELGARL